MPVLPTAFSLRSAGPAMGSNACMPVCTTSQPPPSPGRLLPWPPVQPGRGGVHALDRAPRAGAARVARPRRGAGETRTRERCASSRLCVFACSVLRGLVAWALVPTWGGVGGAARAARPRRRAGEIGANSVVCGRCRSGGWQPVQSCSGVPGAWLAPPATSSQSSAPPLGTAPPAGVPPRRRPPRGRLDGRLPRAPQRRAHPPHGRGPHRRPRAGRGGARDLRSVRSRDLAAAPPPRRPGCGRGARGDAAAASPHALWGASLPRGCHFGFRFGAWFEFRARGSRPSAARPPRRVSAARAPCGPPRRGTAARIARPTAGECTPRPVAARPAAAP